MDDVEKNDAPYEMDVEYNAGVEGGSKGMSAVDFHRSTTTVPSPARTRTDAIPFPAVPFSPMTSYPSSSSTSSIPSLPACQPATSRPKPLPFFRQSLSTSQLAPPLYLIAFLTGLLDSLYADFMVFSSNQTGNAILLTLAAANTASVEIRNTSASLGGFLLCALIAGKCGNKWGCRNRGWLAISNALQITLLLCTTISAATFLPVHHTTHNWILLLMLGSSAGFQVAMAKTSGVSEVPTAMLTSPFVEFVTDKNLFVMRWRGEEVRPRNRRGFYILCLLSGSLCGAYIHRYAGTVPVLIIAVGVRTCVAAYMLFVRVDEAA